MRGFICVAVCEKIWMFVCFWESCLGRPLPCQVRLLGRPTKKSNKKEWIFWCVWWRLRWYGGLFARLSPSSIRLCPDSLLSLISIFLTHQNAKRLKTNLGTSVLRKSTEKSTNLIQPQRSSIRSFQNDISH